MFRQADGTTQTVQMRTGTSLMEAALRAGVRGIDAKCRGNCSCITCHVYLDPSWHDAVGPPGAMEESMLDFADNVDDRSRLSCQVRIDYACEGLVVEVPPAQRVLGF